MRSSRFRSVLLVVAMLFAFTALVSGTVMALEQIPGGAAIQAETQTVVAPEGLMPRIVLAAAIPVSEATPLTLALESLMPGEVLADATAFGITAITVTEEASLSAQVQGTNTTLILAAAFLLSVAVLARSRLRRAYANYKRGGTYELIASALYIRRSLAGIIVAGG